MPAHLDLFPLLPAVGMHYTNSWLHWFETAVRLPCWPARAPMWRLPNPASKTLAAAAQLAQLPRFPRSPKTRTRSRRPLPQRHACTKGR